MRLVTTTGDHITTRNAPGLNFDVADSLSEIKKAGFDGADLNLACYGHGIGIRPLDTPDWEKWCYHVKEVSEKLELPILQAHAPFVSPTTEIEIEEWEEMINARTLFCAELLHIPIIVYHTYIVKEGRSISSSASKNKTIDTLLRFGEKCGKYGARIAIENNVPFYNYFSSPDDLISLVEELNSPVFGICWDFGHGHLSQVDVGKAIRAMGKHLIAMSLLIRTKDIYHFSINEMTIDKKILKRILTVGLPTGVQSILTTVSNVFVQSYVNYFGAACMAGWSCYNKLEQYIMLPIQSIAMGGTTFVSQNIGAKQYSRANKGTMTLIMLTVVITGTIALILFIFAPIAIKMFSNDPNVNSFGVLFLRWNVFFLLFNCINHTLAGSLRGRGDSRAPMIIMLFSFVCIRQAYLYILTHCFINNPIWVGLGYPVGWVCCCIIEVLYYNYRWGKKNEK